MKKIFILLTLVLFLSGCAYKIVKNTEPINNNTINEISEDKSISEDVSKETTKNIKDIDLTNNVSEYGASLMQIGGIGSRIVQSSAFYLNEHGYLNPAEDWISYFFNTPADILTAQCRSGYKLTQCESNSNNETFVDIDMGWCRMIVTDKLQNRLQIKCSSNNVTANYFAPVAPIINDNLNDGCCKHCTTGKACGDSCISRSYTCHKAPGCACDY